MRNTQNLRETGPPVLVFIAMARDHLLSLTEWGVTVGWHSDTATTVCVGVVCALVRAGAIARVYVRPFVMCLQYTIIIFDPG